MPNAYNTEADSLFPEEGFALVYVDDYKPPDSDDYINQMVTYPTADEVQIPNDGYEYHVYGSDGEMWTAEEWAGEMGE